MTAFSICFLLSASEFYKISANQIWVDCVRVITTPQLSDILSLTKIYTSSHDVTHLILPQFRRAELKKVNTSLWRAYIYIYIYIYIYTPNKVRFWPRFAWFTALFTNMRTLKFLSRLHNCVFRCRQSYTITSNEPWNTETHKTDRNPLITNHKPWPFEPVKEKVCFLRGPLRWLTAANNAIVSWLLNFTIRMFVKSAVTRVVEEIWILSDIVISMCRAVIVSIISISRFDVSIRVVYFV